MEGPSLVILRHELQFLTGKKILSATGSSRIDMSRIINRKLKIIRTFGKLLLLTVGSLTVRIHFLMFGSYRINERKDSEPRMSLTFEGSEVNFYTCAVSFVEQDPDEVYDWSSDVMSEHWDARKARRKLKSDPDRNVSDALMDQNIFAGVGNIIKNEVLHRIRVHPNSVIGALPPRKLTELIKEARTYSFDFYEWKKIFQLRKHWQIYRKKNCNRCDLPATLQYTGKNPRRSFYCENCQKLYK